MLNDGMALGAAPINIVRLVVRYGLALGAIGIGVGIVVALGDAAMGPPALWRQRN